MDEKEVNISFVGSDKVIQHIHGANKSQSINKNAQKFFKCKQIISNDIDDIVIDENHSCLTPDKYISKSQTFISTQSELKGSDLFGFKTPRQSSVKRKVSISAKKNFQQVNTPSKDCDDASSSDDDDNLHDCLPKSQTKKKTPKSTKNKSDEKNEVDTAIIEEFFEEEKFSIKTSDRTLSRLPKLDPSELNQLLSNAVFPYEKERQDLCQSYAKHFNEWMLAMKFGSNILLYGLGSKLTILEKFAQHFLSDFLLIIVNGFFPSLSFKSISSGICDLIGMNLSNLNPLQFCNSVQKYLIKNDEDLFLVIHNIDGPSLRNEKLQNDLSHLSQISRMHIVASIDHINASLLWDQTKLNRFSFLWYNVTTFESYARETSYESSLLLSSSGVLQFTSLTHILASLTRNAKKIFIMLAENQVESADDANFQGYTFEDLYIKCREEFLVNSEVTLRAQLSEFIDHKLVRLKKGFDGVEFVNIMLDNSTLSQFIENQNDILQL